MEEMNRLPQQKVIFISAVQNVTTGLTLNEAAVIYSITFCLMLHCVKSRFCPNSWQHSSIIRAKEYIRLKTGQ